jgi:hypothetical protein
METVAPVTDPAIQAELERILGVYENDNTSARLKKWLRG